MVFVVLTVVLTLALSYSIARAARKRRDTMSVKTMVVLGSGTPSHFPPVLAHCGRSSDVVDRILSGGALLGYGCIHAPEVLRWEHADVGFATFGRSPSLPRSMHDPSNAGVRQPATAPLRLLPHRHVALISVPPVTCGRSAAGGHTAEMFQLLQYFDKCKYAPRVYVAARTDRMAASKVQQHEAAWAGDAPGNSAAAAHELVLIPRSREVGQSWVTSALTTALALVTAFGVVARTSPALLLLNGPGTCLPIAAAARALRAVGLGCARIVYLESIARTRRLSLTGAILYHLRMTDEFFVQWPDLARKYPRTRHCGRVY